MDITNIKAVIFDMDGVITDTEPLHMAAERQVCTELGINAPIEMWEGFRGRTTVAIFQTIVAKCCPGQHDPAALAARKQEIYLNEAPDKMQIFPGAREFIIDCARRYPLALTTSSVVEIQKAAFDKFDLAKFFLVTTTGDEVTCGKPDPEPYLLTVSRLNLPPEQCAVIEDSDSGIMSAAAAGCIPCGITHTFPADALRDAGAALVAATFDQLRNQLSL